uniref:Uncharacterized protein n=1 Tax=Timema douglasi TaxID=61478 RepID=A0A7R8V9X8_TIMDO|nr:unnamed protein product [Timema douglasi]
MGNSVPFVLLLHVAAASMALFVLSSLYGYPCLRQFSAVPRGTPVYVRSNLELRLFPAITIMTQQLLLDLQAVNLAPRHAVMMVRVGRTSSTMNYYAGVSDRCKTQQLSICCSEWVILSMVAPGRRYETPVDTLSPVARLSRLSHLSGLPLHSAHWNVPHSLDMRGGPSLVTVQGWLEHCLARYTTPLVNWARPRKHNIIPGLIPLWCTQGLILGSAVWTPSFARTFVFVEVALSILLVPVLPGDALGGTRLPVSCEASPIGAGFMVPCEASLAITRFAVPCEVPASMNLFTLATGRFRHTSSISLIDQMTIVMGVGNPTSVMQKVLLIIYASLSSWPEASSVVPEAVCPHLADRHPFLLYHPFPLPSHDFRMDMTCFSVEGFSSRTCAVAGGGENRVIERGKAGGMCQGTAGGSGLIKISPHKMNRPIQVKPADTENRGVVGLELGQTKSREDK